MIEFSIFRKFMGKNQKISWSCQEFEIMCWPQFLTDFTFSCMKNLDFTYPENLFFRILLVVHCENFGEKWPCLTMLKRDSTAPWFYTWHVRTWTILLAESSICWAVHSLAPRRFQFDIRKVMFKLTLVNGGWGISYEIALRWMPQDVTDGKSTLVQVMAWCRQATSHYLSQCWPRSMSPNGVTRPQWVNSNPPGQNGCHLGRRHFKCIFVNENSSILIKISLNFVSKGPIDNNPALV